MWKIIIFILFTNIALTQDLGIFDSYNFGNESFEKDLNDKDKSVETLLNEAYSLEKQGLYLDSRSKLLLALEKEPDNVLVHIRLSDYYSTKVNHHKLALKYIRKAEKLFKDKSGEPPYKDSLTQSIHQEILLRLADSLTNIDSYDKALDIFLYYENLGYAPELVSSSKAWVLMKLKRLDEALKVAEDCSKIPYYGMGCLNVLAILKSMTGQRQESLDIFKYAYSKELELGSMGNPATPLNNSGEVLREIFRENEAKENWEKAISLPDGCDHILPSLNLMHVNLDKLDLISAKNGIDNFDNCIAMYPLKNGEEHKALLSLAHGRINYYAGNIQDAIKQFKDGINRTQSFGKIGTSSNDLKLALFLSYSLALDASANRMNNTLAKNLIDKIKIKKESLTLKIHSWWLQRKAIKLAIDKLDNFEDLYLRNSDSQIDYPALVFGLSTISNFNIKSKLGELIKKDDRSYSSLYYNAFIQNLTKNKIEELISNTREYDRELKAYLLTKKILLFGNDANAESDLFAINNAFLANFGLKLTVNYEISNQEIIKKLNKTGFRLDNSNKLDYKLVLSGGSLVLFKNGTQVKFYKLGSDLESDLNDFNNLVFSEEL